MDDLAQWLGRQLDEDARNASSWHTLDCDIHAYLQGDADSVKATMSMFHAAPGAVCDCDVPARVLREIDAKRRIIAEHATGRPTMEAHGLARATTRTWDEEANEANCLTLRLLALPYSDRGGYKKRWRP
ncbi:DUF6221 family protein [Streptomyces sp. NPDC059009]|uniref:DUF6221 family protein n=1 Tax=Streptomyces sp. NPDC059009 TaxID=3346694 RepID=UPI0036AFC0F9